MWQPNMSSRHGQMSPEEVKSVCLSPHTPTTFPVSHIYVCTHQELSQLGISRHLTNEYQQTQMQILIPLFAACVVFLDKELKSIWASVSSFSRWDGCYPCTRGVGSQLGLIYVNPRWLWFSSLSEIQHLHLEWARGGPEHGRGGSCFPRVWKEGELEFHSS